MAALHAEHGLTLPEILIAMFVLTVGLLGVAGSLMISNGGIAGAVTGGQAAIERGNATATAIILAQQRMEQVKRLQYRVAPSTPTDEIGGTPGPPSALPDEDYNGIDPVSGVSLYPNYKRRVRVLDATPGANMKTVSVTVTARFAGAQAASGQLSEEEITIRTVIAARP